MPPHNLQASHLLSGPASFLGLPPDAISSHLSSFSLLLSLHPSTLPGHMATGREETHVVDDSVNSAGDFSRSEHRVT